VHDFSGCGKFANVIKIGKKNDRPLDQVNEIWFEGLFLFDRKFLSNKKRSAMDATGAQMNFAS